MTRARWLAAAVLAVAVVVLVVVLARGRDDEPPPEPAGEPVGTGAACGLAPPQDVAAAYGLEAGALRQAYVYRSSAESGVDCLVIGGDSALLDFHLYVGGRASDMWTYDYADVHAGTPLPGSEPVPAELGEGIVQDKRLVIVHRPCGSGELVLVLGDSARRLASDVLVKLARASLPASRDLAGCPG